MNNPAKYSSIDVAKDVAEWIEHSNPRVMLQTVDDDEKVVNNVYTLGGSQESWFLTEDGLYEVLMQSRKPIAKQFKKKVKEILQTIRKHGAYMTPATIENVMNDPDSWIKLLTALKDERSQKEQLQVEAEKNKPKVIFADSVSVSDGTILIRELAKILKGNGVNTGEKRLFEYLRDEGWLIKNKGTDYNTPTQKGMEKGLFKIKESTTTYPDGRVILHKTTVVTGKGQQYFVNHFLNKDLCS